jgi:hypothetical protein
MNWTIWNTYATIMAASIILVALFLDWRLGKHINNKNKKSKQSDENKRGN